MLQRAKNSEFWYIFWPAQRKMLFLTMKTADPGLANKLFLKLDEKLD